ncbi:response regulator transcription factor [Ohessyouella blattaphilus]|uniref:Stage 0 sporulation protein A homolog n=1 Tax=Ohessyouella blattaphilus TaxID=2949333 RepID=A0ABT1EIL5_9FIRM|nr:response regulator [Ohessyouella blattaphilus]MCP1110544.1 response regulator [Ohessyouella blattaphilus]MCR8563938.1 response regulator [Ohessyouella blattaphilus]MDL2249458.1 response regulator [Lachnospiraceae bacterium OttesenSCG-928-J05]
MNLLIADDEKAIRQGMMSLPWEDIGINQVFEAENGIQAKAVLHEKVVDIVISDIKMPGMTGLELAEYIKEYDLDTVIILLTGFSDFCYAQEAIRYNVVDYMLKPLRPRDIMNTVARSGERLKQIRYQEKVVRQYEREADSVDLSNQIRHHFRDTNPQTKMILQDMSKNFTQDISLNSMAEKYHFSVAYLSRMIRKETGFSFSEMLVSMRLTEAVQQLEDEKVKIGQVAEKSGFSDYRYFSQVFKKTLGCSPGEYRRSGDKQRIYGLKSMLEMTREKK